MIVLQFCNLFRDKDSTRGKIQQRLYYYSSETWNRLSRKDMDASSLELFQGQARWCSEQPGIVGGILAPGRGVTDLPT